MHNNVLNEGQLGLLTFLKEFSSDFYLVGGTAIALHLGHRKSIDFDLFTKSKINKNSILGKVRKYNYKVDYVLVDSIDEFTIVINGVKLSFVTFPFDVEHNYELIKGIINSPDLLTLAALKAYAIGRRSKWKDYVDIYFLLNNGYEISAISDLSKKIFFGGFEEKLFRKQLTYFEDIDYTEQVEYINDELDNEKIQEYLILSSSKL